MTTTAQDQLVDGLALTDGGIETVLIYGHGVDLPDFASFPLVTQESGRQLLTSYYRDYLGLAASRGTGFVLETPTWRASSDWGARLGYTPQDLWDVNVRSVELMAALRNEWSGDGPVVLSGCTGPRGDGYVVGRAMTRDEAADYHRPQISALASAGVDLVTSFTLSYVEEAVGFADAASDVGVACVVGFTVETDGLLPSGTTLGDAVSRVDAESTSAPAWFMLNCAHTAHVANAIPHDDPAWLARVGALRANASRRSHAELDASDTLDPGDVDDLARGAVALHSRLPSLRVLGGCCGTDVSHVTAMADAVLGS